MSYKALYDILCSVKRHMNVRVIFRCDKNKNYRGPHYMHEAAQRVDNCKQQLNFFTKAMVRPRTRADHGQPRGNQAHGGKGRGWV